MSRAKKVWLDRVVFATAAAIFTALLFSALRPDAEKIATAEETLDSIQRLNYELMQCFPGDIGEKSTLSVELEDGVAKLKCARAVMPKQDMAIVLNAPLYGY